MVHACGRGAAAWQLPLRRDQAGHLLGEYDKSGAALREYIWLDDVPVALFTPSATASAAPVLYYIHTDHLNTPRAVVDTAGNLRWRWIADPFGTAVPETNPAGLGAFVQNLRMPGQYADSETGLFYNMARYYDPMIGRYVESDPIGLTGGINTYAYVGNNPLRLIDPLGLSPQDVKNIISDYRNIVDQMTNRGQHNPDKVKNNFCCRYPRFPGCKNPNDYKDCGEQTELVNEKLAGGKYDDRWFFLMDAGFGHAWGIATSSNPSDPVIYYDPRADQISIGQPCSACSGWLGDRGYGVNNPPPRPR